MVTATSLLDPTNQIVRVNTTAALFTQLWPGLSYDITVVAISVFGGVSAVGPASNKETFNTEPNGKIANGCIHLGCDHCIVQFQPQLLRAEI